MIGLPSTHPHHYIFYNNHEGKQSYWAQLPSRNSRWASSGLGLQKPTHFGRYSNIEVEIAPVTTNEKPQVVLEDVKGKEEKGKPVAEKEVNESPP